MGVKAILLRYWRGFAAGALVLAALSGCARQSLEQRAALEVKSAAAWDDFLSELTPYDDPALTAYVEGVLKRVAGPKASTPRIQVMDSSYPHAYVSRRYGIRITRGMLATLQSEAELAFIIGHELSHLHQSAGPDFRHLNLKSTKDPAAALARASDQRMGLEVMADQRAAFLLKEAGYDGGAAQRVLASFERGAESDSDGYDMLFRTHPSSAERVALLPPGKKGDVDADRYLQAIDGMPFRLPGAALHQKGGRIIAPSLALTMPAPDGLGFPENNDGSLTFSRPGDNMSFTVSVYVAEPQSAVSALEGPIYKAMSRGIFSDFDGDVSLQSLSDVRQFDIAPGVTGASGVARMTNTDPIAEIWMATIASKQRWMLATYVYPSNRRGQARKVIEAFETGFETIPTQQRPRLRLKRYTPGDRLERLAAGFGKGPEAVERFRWVNGLGKSDMPKSGQLVKTIIQE